MKPNFVLPATWMVAGSFIGDKHREGAESRQAFRQAEPGRTAGDAVRATFAIDTIMNCPLSIINCPLCQ